MKINARVVLWAGTSACLVAAALSQSKPLGGAVIGLWMGYINVERLFKETHDIAGLDLQGALRKFQRRFLTRLGFAALLAVIIVKWQPELFSGLIIALIISLMVFILLKVQQAIW
ncbi:MAG: hypothetical protein LBT32_02955 [Peptococcaceae bacterium]|jgi:hypothetical protein|nr:hypothetical protein [Peptococcaceae bacterium]